MGYFSGARRIFDSDAAAVEVAFVEADQVDQAQLGSIPALPLILRYIWTGRDAYPTESNKWTGRDAYPTENNKWTGRDAYPTEDNKWTGRDAYPTESN